MKNKKEKTKKSRGGENKNPPSQREDSGLGQWGLEPPKIYRSDQRLNDFSNAERNRQRKDNSKNNKTIQQQRIDENKRRKQKKITRKIIRSTALALGIVAVVTVLSLTVLFKIQTISINGNERYSKQEIMAVLPIEKQKNLFLADTKSAKSKLEENLPYIYNADIRRKFPSTINVNITETPKIYSIKNADKTYTLLDDRLKVLENSSAKKPKKATAIKKAEIKSAVPGQEVQFKNKKTADNLIILINAVQSMKLDKISAVCSVDINNNYIIYDSRITIKLGETDGIEDKINSAFAAIEKIEEQNPLAEGELTVGTGKQIYFTEK